MPHWLLAPGILAVSAVGVYAVHATTFDLLLMTGLGVVAYLLRKQNVPMAPLILGFFLGDLMEQNLRRALSINNGDASILVQSPIFIGLWIGAVLMVVHPLLGALSKRKAKQAPVVRPEPTAPVSSSATGETLHGRACGAPCPAQHVGKS